MNTLLPIGTLVYHDGHGNGTIVDYNGRKANVYVQENLDSPEVAAAFIAGLGEAIVTSFYSNDLYPYVVQFEPSERFPEGYKDVYDVDDAVMVVRNLK